MSILSNLFYFQLKISIKLWPWLQFIRLRVVSSPAGGAALTLPSLLTIGASHAPKPLASSDLHTHNTSILGNHHSGTPPSDKPLTLHTTCQRVIWQMLCLLWHEHVRANELLTLAVLGPVVEGVCTYGFLHVNEKTGLNDSQKTDSLWWPTRWLKWLENLISLTLNKVLPIAGASIMLIGAVAACNEGVCKRNGGQWPRPPCREAVSLCGRFAHWRVCETGHYIPPPV